LRKIAFILSQVILIIGCSVTRNVIVEKPDKFNRYDSDNVAESVRQQNITRGGFFIEKAEIEVNNNNGKEKYLANIKFNPPDKYLISLKGRSGIEGARIYMTTDTILVNDRINQIEYYGSSFYLRKKYGFSMNSVPLIFGDLVIDENFKKNANKCLEDKLEFESNVKGVTLNYTIDCKKRKVIVVDQINNLIQPGIKITYDRFHIIGDILVPESIELNDYQYNTTIRIKIIKILKPWNGDIKFIPGRDYDLIELV
jgi:uncharacterized protein YxeA